MKYDVLTEPWITARRGDGSIQSYGVRDLLLSAHLLTEIVEGEPHYEFGIYRMLFVFLMDAYRPKNQEAIEDILDEGFFDSSTLDAYIEDCKKDGATFDLFDSGRPFLQCGEKEWDKCPLEKSVAVLNPTVPSGNNHVHFDHTFSADAWVSVPEAAKALCAANLFCTAGAQGYPSTPNGAPPLYCIVKGKNLFETLVFGMVPANACNISYADPPAIWRNSAHVESKKKVASTSLLYGLLFPCRRVKLVTNKERPNEIRTILYEQGMNFVNYAAWLDPHVAYHKNKDGEMVNVKANIDRESWRDLDSLVNYRQGAPSVVNQFIDIRSDSMKIELMTYAAVTNQAAYLDMKRGEFEISTEIVRSSKRFEAMQYTISQIENGSRRLSFALQLLQKELNRDGKNGALASEAKRSLDRYYFDCRQRFLNDYCPRLAVVGEGELSGLIGQWREDIVQLTSILFDNYVDRIGAAATVLILSQNCKRPLFSTDETKDSNSNKKQRKG